MKDKNSIEQRFCGNCLWFDGDFEDEMQFCDDKRTMVLFTLERLLSLEKEI